MHANDSDLLSKASSLEQHLKLNYVFFIICSLCTPKLLDIVTLDYYKNRLQGDQFYSPKEKPSLYT